MNDLALRTVAGLDPEEQAYERGVLTGMGGYAPRPPVEPHLERAYKMGYIDGQAERSEAVAQMLHVTELCENGGSWD